MKYLRVKLRRVVRLDVQQIVHGPPHIVLVLNVRQLAVNYIIGVRNEPSIVAIVSICLRVLRISIHRSTSTSMVVLVVLLVHEVITIRRSIVHQSCVVHQLLFRPIDRSHLWRPIDNHIPNILHRFGPSITPTRTSRWHRLGTSHATDLLLFRFRHAAAVIPSAAVVLQRVHRTCLLVALLLELLLLVVHVLLTAKVGLHKVLLLALHCRSCCSRCQMTILLSTRVQHESHLGLLRVVVMMMILVIEHELIVLVIR